MNQTVKTLKIWAASNKQLAESVLAARLISEIEAKRVAEYIAPIFAAYTFIDEEGEKITNRDHLYMCDDDDACSTYYAACDAAHVANGFDGPEGCSPELIAESLVRDAETALEDSMLAFMGITGPVYNMKHRAEILGRAMDCCLCTLV